MNSKEMAEELVVLIIETAIEKENACFRETKIRADKLFSRIENLIVTFIEDKYEYDDSLTTRMVSLDDWWQELKEEHGL